MNSKVVGALMFIAGVAVGSVASFYVLKNKFEEVAEEEIKEMRDHYKEKINKVNDKKEKIEQITEAILSTTDTDGDVVKEPTGKPEVTKAEIKKQEKKKSITDYAKIIEDQKYDSEENKKNHIHVISPEEYGEKEDYEQNDFTLYSDGTLTDDMNEPVSNFKELIGDALEHFGDYEEDAVHVRNDKEKTYYEILKDLDPYSIE